MLSRKKIAINSRNRESGNDSHFSYKIKLPQPNRFKYVSCLKVLIPKSYYLVGENQTFTLQEGETNTEITFTQGSYSRKNFQANMQALLNEYGTWDYTVSYPSIQENDPDTGKWTITVANNANVQPSLIFTNYLYEQFGFSKDSTNTFVEDSITSDNVIKLQAEDTLVIHSSLVNNDGDDILETVFATAELSYSNVIWNNPCPLENATLLTTNTNNIYDFSITNEDGINIDINGLNAVIVLLFFEPLDNFYNLLKMAAKIRLGKEKVRLENRNN